MFNRDIKCTSCGKSGQIKAHDTIGRLADVHLFEPIGKTANGYMVFKCPKCNEKVIKSPYDFIFTKKVKLAIAFVVIVTLLCLLLK